MSLMVRNLFKSYGKQSALSGIDLSLETGTIGLLGANGSGKSTLLRLLATVLEPDTGEISFNGQSYLGNLSLIRYRLGYLPQNLNLPKFLSPRNFLRYLAHIKDINDIDRVPTLLKTFRLDAVADKNIETLSTGQIRLLGFVQAVLNNPDLLLLDEPLRGLDTNESERALRFMHTIGSQQLVIFSSHLPSEVERVAQKVIILHKGSLLFIGDIQELIEQTIGNVCELKTSAKLALGIAQSFLVSRLVTVGEDATVRIVGAAPAGFDTKPVFPSLEDAYLYMSRNNNQRG